MSGNAPSQLEIISGKLFQLQCPMIDTLTKEDLKEVLFGPKISARASLIKWLYIQLSPKFTRILNDYLPAEESNLIENLVVIGSTTGLCNMEEGVSLIEGKVSQQRQFRFWVDLLELIELSVEDSNNSDRAQSNLCDSFSAIFHMVDKTSTNAMKYVESEQKLFTSRYDYVHDVNSSSKDSDLVTKSYTILAKTKEMIESDKLKLKSTIIDFENENNDNLPTNVQSTTRQKNNYSVSGPNSGLMMWDKRTVCEVASLKKILTENINDFNTLIKQKFKPFLHRNMKNIDFEEGCVRLDQPLLDSVLSDSLMLSNYVDNLRNINKSVEVITSVANSLETNTFSNELPDDFIPKKLLGILTQSVAANGDDYPNPLCQIFSYEDPMWDLGQP